jgi:hypothetical protein
VLRIALWAFQQAADFLTTNRTTTGTGKSYWSASPLVTLPNNLQAQMGTDRSPVGQIMFCTLTGAGVGAEVA